MERRSWCRCLPALSAALPDADIQTKVMTQRLATLLNIIGIHISKRRVVRTAPARVISIVSTTQPKSGGGGGGILTFSGPRHQRLA